MAKGKTDERFTRILAAAEDERQRFNRAVGEGATAILATAFGPYRVEWVSADFWYTTYPVEGRRDSFSERSFAGANDGAWASLLHQVGVERNPLWEALRRAEAVR